MRHHTTPHHTTPHHSSLQTLHHATPHHTYYLLLAMNYLLSTPYCTLPFAYYLLLSALLSLFRCEDCLPGKFAIDQGMSFCSDCSLGKYQPLPSATECVQCATGVTRLLCTAHPLLASHADAHTRCVYSYSCSFGTTRAVLERSSCYCHCATIHLRRPQRRQRLQGVCRMRRWLLPERDFQCFEQHADKNMRAVPGVRRGRMPVECHNRHDVTRSWILASLRCNSAKLEAPPTTTTIATHTHTHTRTHIRTHAHTHTPPPPPPPPPPPRQRQRQRQQQQQQQQQRR